MELVYQWFASAVMHLYQCCVKVGSLGKYMSSTITITEILVSNILAVEHRLFESLRTAILTCSKSINQILRSNKSIMLSQVLNQWLLLNIYNKIID